MGHMSCNEFSSFGQVGIRFLPGHITRRYITTIGIGTSFSNYRCVSTGFGLGISQPKLTCVSGDAYNTSIVYGGIIYSRNRVNNF